MSMMRSWVLWGLVAVGLVGCGGGGGGGGGADTPTGGTGSSAAAAPTAPVITTQPANQSVIAGQKAVFMPTVNGSAPVAIQWRRNNQDIPEATNTIYETAPTTNADNGSQFSFVATNSAGSVVSNVATLTVNSAATATGAPVITQQSPSYFTADGSSVTLQVTVIGTPPLTYQWTKNGQVIADANGPTYTFPNPALTDTGVLFRVSVTNGLGTATSQNMLLTVAAVPPQFTVQPLPRTVAVGDTASFNVAVAGSKPMTFQWYRNGTPISNATGMSYTTPAVSLSDSGATFSVIANNPTGNVSSQTVALTVDAGSPSSTGLPIDIATMKALSSRGTSAATISYSHVAKQIVDTVGTTTVTLTSLTYPNATPLQFTQALALAGFNDGSFNSDLTLPTTNLVLNNSSAGSINGFNVSRFSRASVLGGSSNPSVLNSFVLDGFSGGFRFTNIDVWKYIAPFQSGYFAGWPTVRGAYIAGAATPNSAIPTIVSNTYTGYAYAGLEGVGSNLIDFNSISLGISVVYSASTGSINITMSDAKGYLETSSISYPNISTISDWPTGTSFVWSPISCNTQLIVPTGSFTCNVSGSLSGKIDGKFFGPSGSEIAATFTLLPAGSDSGMVGAFMAKVP